MNEPPTSAEQLVNGLTDAVDAFNRGEPVTIPTPTGRVIVHPAHARPKCHKCGQPDCQNPTTPDEAR